MTVAQGGRPGALTAPLVLAALVLALHAPPLVAADAARLDSAEYEYGLGGVASGEIAARCLAQALLFPTDRVGSLRLWSNGGVIESYTTEWNTTFVFPQSENPTIVRGDITQSRSVESFAAGEAAVAWHRPARVRVFGAHWAEGEPASPIVAELQAQTVRSTPPSLEVDPGPYYVQATGVVEVQRWGVPGWSRVIEATNGTLRATGDLTIYLESAIAVDGQGTSHEVKPHEDESLFANAAAAQRRDRHHHALLRLSGASVEIEAGEAALACPALEGTVNGTLLVQGAQGNVAAGNLTLPFGPADLSLVGSFQFAEAFNREDPPGVKAQVIGSFEVVGLDYADSGLTSGRSQVLLVAGTATALGLLAFATWWFYTRLQKPALLDLESRNLVHEALRANPWSTVAEIQRVTGLRRSTVRYQMAVLRRHGLVRAAHAGARARFAPTSDVNLPPPPTDPLVRTIEAALQPGPLRLADIMRALMDGHDISRYGAWKAIRRASTSGVVELERGPKEVWVRFRA